MMLLFFITLGVLAVLIQFHAVGTALKSMNYWRVKRSLLDLGVDTVVFTVSATGGVVGFYMAAAASLAITVYLHFRTNEKIKLPQPRWWQFMRVVLGKCNNQF